MRIVRRPVTEEDRKTNRYYEHLAERTGSVTNVYDGDQIAVVLDPASLSDVMLSVKDTATVRMREKFLGNVSDEQRKLLSKEEVEFSANYVALVRAEDLEAA